MELVEKGQDAPEAVEPDAIPVAGTFRLEPLQDRVLIQRFREREESAGGIHMVESAREKPLLGRVLAIGEGKLLESGQIQAMRVAVGDIVLLHEFAGLELPKDLGERLWMVREDELLGIVSPIDPEAAVS